MRLCGISSRFRLLSPCAGQVAHALLTRPPLTYYSLGFLISPFDLHVLGTPPAFILSQDRTLDFKILPCQFSLAFFLRGLPPPLLLYCPLVILKNSLKIFSEFSGSHYCSFVKVPRGSRHAACNRNSDILSRGLPLVNSFFPVFRGFFSALRDAAYRRFRGRWTFNIPSLPRFVNRFFILFTQSFFNSLSGKKLFSFQFLC